MINFLGLETAGWGGGLPHEGGGGRKVRALPRKFVFLGFRREEPEMSRGNLPGCPGPLEVQKKFVLIFRPLITQIYYKRNSLTTFSLATPKSRKRRTGLFQGILLWMLRPGWTEVIGNGPNAVSESTASNTELNEFLGRHRAPRRELSEFLSAYDLCAKANSPSLLQNSLSLP